ncbi:MULTISPECIES: ATP-binding protein [Nocardiopsis]|jgi:anti-sigma regulatory factor (Ser/Thr protein kinase)|uniref:ATP-binding protein n=2 Tax=Nocardiopsis alba TaxID=53437 RepID=A0A7K2IVV1_9ACTN|nr:MULTISPECIES: ATP-binding protein [Nocardiopsis]AFR09224.1 histidine kinase-, DNA gyrase B-, and HSP90-like ATPase family protein [Nocardiopsis alba ATCC BAA-2165]MEC3894323.1 ATP-binding protein [Nocardiopsis sp. LDBS1602]MYR34109.1 ATP-binding protein [Nocardiopsis alba]
MSETTTPRSAPSDPLLTTSAPLIRPQRPARPMEEPNSIGQATAHHGGAVPLSAQRRFPGLPSQIAYVRRFVARRLADSPELTTATLLASELATNAITHSASGRATGKFEVCVLQAPGWARVEVRDLGSTTEEPEPQHRDPYDTAEHGRGLDLVEALSSSWGTEPRKDGRGRQVWFEIVWDGDDR